MRKPVWRCARLVVGIVTLACLSAGCRSGGWNMPSANWLSWNKKKPPASSIAGTRDPIPPPSVSVPPYSPAGSSGSSALATTTETPAVGSDPTSVASAASPLGGRTEASASPAADTSGYAVGPYSLGSAGSPATPADTDRGFYAPAAAAAGPVASTADARSGYSPTASSPWEVSSPSAGFPAPTGGGDFAPLATPDTGYGAAASYPATGYPATMGSATAPQTPLPYGGPAAPSYPSTSADPVGGYSSFPTTVAPAMPAPSSAPSAPLGSAAYGGVAPAYPAPLPGGGPEAAAGPMYDARATSGVPTVPASTGGYRPGSTGRNSSLLDPPTGTSSDAPANSGSYYQR